jgi:hypothetical protein
MKHLHVLYFVALGSAVAVACGETDDPVSLPGTDASATDAGAVDATKDTSTPPSDGGTTVDASTTDTSTPDTSVVDAAPCPIAFDAGVVATIKTTADDYLMMWFNGVLVDDKQTTWGTVDTTNVTLHLNPTRKNVIAVAARNAFNTSGFDRGLLAELSFASDAGADGGIPPIVTDTSWKMSPEPDGGLPDGGQGAAAWFDPAFDDSAWAAPFDEGAHGMAPWGNVFGTSSAHWLWSYNSSTASSKPTSEIVYFRKTFYMNTAGTPQNTPPTCP